MNTQIVYYFGAGASIEAIPSVNGLRNRFDDVVKYLDRFNRAGKNVIQFDNETSENVRNNQDVLRQIVQDIKWLKQESENHQTVDTMAKKLFVQEDVPNLNRLKRALLSYFFLEQSLQIKGNDENGKIVYDRVLDRRYDNLVASIAYRADGEIKLLGKVKIITWNYDLQIDYAIQNFVKKTSLNKVKEAYNIHPNINSFNVKSGDLINLKEFAVFKLNGNAFLDPSLNAGAGGGKTPHDYEIPNTQRSEGSILGDYLNTFDETFPEGKTGSPDTFNYFNFAWEAHDRYTGFNNLIANTKQVLRETRILIIVGYSFPFFNSYIDKQLLSECNPFEIIIQDLEPETIKKRLLDLVPAFAKTNDKGNTIIRFTLIPPSQYFPLPSVLGSD